MDTAAVLPHVNAALNTLSTILLVIGLVLIKTRHRELHRKVMLAAIIVSALFLVSYLTYHFTAPIFVFPGTGWTVPVYYAMLISHVILATLVTPLIVMTALRGIRAWSAGGNTYQPGLFDRHMALARWTLPIWLYVTVTGVAIYVILYHVYPTTP